MINRCESIGCVFFKKENNMPRCTNSNVHKTYDDSNNEIYDSKNCRSYYIDDED